ncbi:arf-GAP with SH3 domain-containing protein [Thecamonas trahens ATCC 50062]|uniref:Arf-GAP with SH3 domain-containing protein n=1 Tax=Thecamonas trahens ATCC 50062 TaxID=461836 RepID=A0A0L0DR41_THETB|nr:arf-GAP with SH3 domain-containing protein [Thecamonas trahens ATCC 50062]KNC54779.1 arf-GAP with SH3 domain-containing protein [Thecamonas trahens ATCC 50062]|eukprot:XP_013761679.1 arf-GAP with SH3 domain-containing protein [Thecamonas trahens ATCC 50062]
MSSTDVKGSGACVFVPYEEDTPEFRERVKAAETNVDDYKKRVKKIADRAKNVQKASASLVDSMGSLVDELMQLSMLDAVYKPGNDPFSKGVADLVAVLNTVNTLQQNWQNTIGATLVQPLEDLGKTGFKKYEDSKKAYRKAISKHESAFSKLLSVKEATTAEDKLEMQKTADSAVVALQSGTLDHLEAINELDSKKLMVVLDRLRAFTDVTAQLFVAGSEALVTVKPTLRDIQTKVIERRRVLNSEDRDLFVAARAQVNTAKREQAMATHELEMELRAAQPMTELEREELNIVPGPLSPFAREKVGWIYKKAGKRMITKWDKRFAILRNGIFRLYRTLQSDVSEPSTELNVMVANVKPLPEQSSSRPNVFQMVGVERTYYLQAEDEEQMNEWLNVIQNATAYALATAESAASSSAKANSVHPLKEDLLGVDELEKALFALWDTPGNETCCDCFAPRPQWVSINLGCLICIECSGHHRNLGVHISKVRSFRLDDWDATVMAYLQNMGNVRVNSVYEADQARVVRYRPKDETNALMREAYIKKKYEQRFLVARADDPDAEAPNSDRAGLLLFNAAVRGDPVAILLELARGADINWVSLESSSYTPLHASVSHGHIHASTCLVLNTADTNKADLYGKTPLHIAAAANRGELLRLLLKNDADPKVTDVQGMTPLDHANLAGAEETAAFLTRLEAPYQYEFIPGGSGQGYDQPFRPQPLARVDDPLPPPPVAASTSRTDRTMSDNSIASLQIKNQAAGKRQRPRSIALQSNVDVIPADDGTAGTVKLRRNLPSLPPPSLKPKPKASP